MADMSALLPALPETTLSTCARRPRSSCEKKRFSAAIGLAGNTPRLMTDQRGTVPGGTADSEGGRASPLCGLQEDPSLPPPSSGWPSPLLELHHPLHRHMATCCPWVPMSLLFF